MRSSRPSASPALPSNRTLGCLLGGVFGMLLTLCLGIGILALTPAEEVPADGRPAPAEYDVEAIIEEEYLNRTFVESAATMPQPVDILAGQMDVQPGGRAAFAVQPRIGPLRPVVRGWLLFRATETGDLEISLGDVRLGRISVKAFVPNGVLDGVNREVNRQLDERTRPADLGLIAVRSDDTTLRFYLASTE